MELYTEHNGLVSTTAAEEPENPEEPSCNLYVQGLPQSYYHKKVTKLFQKFGPVFSVVVFKSRRSACVQFESVDSAITAKAALHGERLTTTNRVLNIRYARKTYKPHTEESPSEEADSPKDSPVEEADSPNSSLSTSPAQTLSSLLSCLASENGSVGPSSEAAAESGEENPSGGYKPQRSQQPSADVVDSAQKTWAWVHAVSQASSIRSAEPPTPQAIAQANHLLEQWVLEL
jgi:RNA recognition motif-containing protein